MHVENYHEMISASASSWTVKAAAIVVVVVASFKSPGCQDEKLSWDALRRSSASFYSIPNLPFHLAWKTQMLYILTDWLLYSLKFPFLRLNELLHLYLCKKIYSVDQMK